MTGAIIVAPFGALALTLALVLADAILAAARPPQTKENHVHPHQ